MKYTAYIFDFDGTLVDSMPIFEKVMLKILDENNIKYGDDIIKVITPLGSVGIAEHFRKLGADLSVDEILGLMFEYAYDDYVNTIPAKKNVISVLEQLKKSGAKLNVLTASTHAVLDPCLKRLGLYDLFDNVWSCDDFSTTKTNPEIYVTAAERIGESIENILFLDDNYNADKAAKSAGMAVCGVFDKSSQQYTDDIKKIADHYITDFAELLDI